MRIAYGKLGRSIPLTREDSSNIGGDIEVVNLLHRLLAEGHEVHLIGRNRSNQRRPFPQPQPMIASSPLVNHWAPGGAYDDPPEADRHMGDKFLRYDKWLTECAKKLPDFDAVFIWLGQHGSSLHPVPAVRKGKIGTFTNPMISDVNYGYPLIAFCNDTKTRPYFLSPDPRNMIKFRDLWNPDQRTILAQFNTSKKNTFWDENDEKLRKGSTQYKYTGIEMLATSHVHVNRHQRGIPTQLFGVLVNEGYNNLGKKGRLALVQRWLPPMSHIVGTWSESSMRELGQRISPVTLSEVLPTLQKWRATITFPASGTGWATAKPWECFAAGTVCFRAPGYDSQGHIYSRHHMPEDLYDFLTLTYREDLEERVKQLADEKFWQHVIGQQWDYLYASRKRLEGGYKFIGETIDESS